MALVLGVAGELLATLGVLVIAFAGWQLWWTDVEADAGQADEVAALERSFAEGGLDVPLPGGPSPSGSSAAPPAHESPPASSSTGSPAPRPRGPASPGAHPSSTPGSRPGTDPGEGDDPGFVPPGGGRGDARRGRPAAPTPRAPARAFAVLRIPAFGARYARPIVEGTQTAQLKIGIGHTPGTALPGQVGNFATAGHRVTYGKPYRRIDELRAGDPLVVETAAGWAVYRYERSRIVTPRTVEVLSPVPDRPGLAPTQGWMTLVACHPPFSAQQRYVGYARLDRVVPRSAGPPPELRTG